MNKQPLLVPLSNEERISLLFEALKKYGRHSLYCNWNGQFYARDGYGCTCGLAEALEKGKGNGIDNVG